MTTLYSHKQVGVFLLFILPIVILTVNTHRFFMYRNQFLNHIILWKYTKYIMMQVKPLNLESERSSTKCNLKGLTPINCIILLNNEYSERFCVYKVDKNSSFLKATAI